MVVFKIIAFDLLVVRHCRVHCIWVKLGSYDIFIGIFISGWNWDHMLFSLVYSHLGEIGIICYFHWYIHIWVKFGIICSYIHICLLFHWYIHIWVKNPDLPIFIGIFISGWRIQTYLFSLVYSYLGEGSGLNYFHWYIHIWMKGQVLPIFIGIFISGWRVRTYLFSLVYSYLGEGSCSRTYLFSLVYSYLGEGSGSWPLTS